MNLINDLRRNYGIRFDLDTSSLLNQIVPSSGVLERALRRRPAESLTAYFNVACIVAGSGILSVPYAIVQKWWLPGTILIMLAIAMACYINREHIVSLRRNRNLSVLQAAHAAFENVKSIVVGLFYGLIAIGSQILPSILSKDDLEAIFETMSDSVRNNLKTKNWTYICAAVVGISLISMRRDGACLSFSSIIIVVFIVLAVLVMPTIGYYILSCGRDVIEASMQLLSAAENTLAVTLVYLMVGIPAYLTYERGTISPAYINLPSGLASILAIAMFITHSLLALPIYLVLFILERLFRISKKEYDRFLRILLCVAVVLTVVKLAKPTPSQK